MRLCHAHVSTKFEANRSKNTATGAQKPPKLQFLRHIDATLLRHDVPFHMVRCACTMSMYVLNLKQIGQKQSHSSPKRPKLTFYVITSRRRYVMTSFFTWYDALIPCPCLYQIWSKSVEKHGHSGPKTLKMAQNGRFYVITSRRRCVIKISTPSLHPPHPPLHPVQVSWRSIERSRSLNSCKKVVGGVVVVKW